MDETKDLSRGGRSFVFHGKEFLTQSQQGQQSLSLAQYKLC